jgi:hypothetical protein
MVDIDFIKTTHCPICGCQTVISESVEIENGTHKARVHTNGGKWEYRTFACGYGVHYCPNFSKEQVVHKCDFDADEIKKKKQNEQAKNDVIAYIEDITCSDEYRERLKDAIKYI